MRYVILVILNLPVIFLALVNILTQYKMHRISKERFSRQLVLWLIILIVLIASFPVYNYFSEKPLLDSSGFSSFDIVQTTAIVLMFYIANNQRQKNERNEKTIRELHQEISIKLSDKNGKS